MLDHAVMERDERTSSLAFIQVARALLCSQISPSTQINMCITSHYLSSPAESYNITACCMHLIPVDPPVIGVEGYH